MTVGNMHQKFDKDRTCSSGDILVDRKTDRYTDLLITILVLPLRGLQGDECILCYTMLQVTTGATANLSTQISQHWYNIWSWTTIIISGSILP